MAGPSMNAFDEVNPGFRLYYLDPETFLPVDYEQYFFDMVEGMGQHFQIISSPADLERALLSLCMAVRSRKDPRSLPCT